MKVAIVMPLAEKRGGGEKRLYDLMLEGRNSGIEWLVIFLAYGSLVEEVQSLGIKVYVVPSGRLSHLYQFLSTVHKITSLVKREQADIILAWMWKAHYYSSLVAILAHIPSLWSQLETPDTSLLKRLAALLPTSGIFINSKSGKLKLEKISPYRPIYLVYPGVDLCQFNPSTLPSVMETRRKLGLPSSSPLIGIVGRLQRWKGMHILIEAMPEVLQKYPDAYCIVVGGKHNSEPNYEKFIRDTIQALSLHDRVIMTGFQKNIPEWIQAMDIFVHASNNEPFGIVVVEAMSLAKPVVASNCGGPTEIITSSVNGLLTPFGDKNSLSKAILKYLDDKEFANNIAMAARQRALDFSTKRFAQAFIESIYSSLT